MTSLRETAQEYEPTKVENIADLESISIDAEIVEKTYGQGSENEFTINVITVEGVDYRMPISVIAQLNALFEKGKSFEFFSVLKTGSGMGTKYSVIPVY